LKNYHRCWATLPEHLPSTTAICGRTPGDDNENTSGKIERSRGWIFNQTNLNHMGNLGWFATGCMANTTVRIYSRLFCDLIKLNSGYRTVIVYKKGRYGFLGEHPSMDGTPPLRMSESNSPAANSTSDHQSRPPSPTSLNSSCN
jgi:hypothetical protein